MRPNEFWRRVSKESGIAIPNVKAVLDAAQLVIKRDVWAEHKTLTLLDFGTFEVRHRAEHTGYDFRSNKKILVKEMYQPTLRVPKTLHQIVESDESE